MGSQMSSYLLYFGVGLTAILWGMVLVPRWAKAAERRGGLWYLEGLLIICGPATTAVMAMYPHNTGDVVTGPFPMINRWLSYVGVGLIVVAITKGLRHPRKEMGLVIAAVAFYYLALVLSCLGGAVASFPEPYWVSPLLVMAFLIPADYTHDWFLKVSRIALRVILVSSFVALLNPTIGFNYDENRTFLGLARMQGITPHPNTFAFIVVIGLILEMSAGSKLIWKLLYVAGILMAQSTTAYLMAAVGLLIISNRLSKLARVAASISAFVFACLALVNTEWAAQVIEEVLPSTAGSFNGRTAIWAAVLFGFESNPVFGYGPSLLDEDYRQQYLPYFDAAAQAHNQWYQTLGGTGIIGVASLVILGLVMLGVALRSRKATRGLTLAMFVVMVLRGVTETPLRPSGMSIATFCLIIVLVVIASAPRGDVDVQREIGAEKAVRRPFASGIRLGSASSERGGVPIAADPVTA